MVCVCFYRHTYRYRIYTVCIYTVYICVCVCNCKVMARQVTVCYGRLPWLVVGVGPHTVVKPAA